MRPRRRTYTRCGPRSTLTDQGPEVQRPGEDGEAVAGSTWSSLYRLVPRINHGIVGPAQAMIEACALGSGMRRYAPPELARGRMKPKRADHLIAGVSGPAFPTHPRRTRPDAWLEPDRRTRSQTKIDTLTARIEQLLAATPEASQSTPPPHGPTRSHESRDCPNPGRMREDSPRSSGSTRSPDRRTQRTGDARRDLEDNGVPHPRAPGVVGENCAHAHPVRAPHPRAGTHGPPKGNPSTEGRAGRRLRSGQRKTSTSSANAYTPHRPNRAPRQAQAPCRGRPPPSGGHRLELLKRPHRGLPRFHGTTSTDYHTNPPSR